MEIVTLHGAAIYAWGCYLFVHGSLDHMNAQTLHAYGTAACALQFLHSVWHYIKSHLLELKG